MNYGFVFILILMFFAALGLTDTSAPMRNPVDITSISPFKN